MLIKCKKWYIFHFVSVSDLEKIERIVGKKNILVPYRKDVKFDSKGKVKEIKIPCLDYGFVRFNNGEECSQVSQICMVFYEECYNTKQAKSILSKLTELFKDNYEF